MTKTKTCEWCERPLVGKQRQYCSKTCKKRVWRSDPENAERDRATSRRWKDEHPEQNRATGFVYRRSIAGTCDTCGGSLGAGVTAGECKSCKSVRRHERALTIVEMWNEGAKLAEIAAALDWTKNTLGVEIHRLRAAGYHIPYRCKRA